MTKTVEELLGDVTEQYAKINEQLKNEADKFVSASKKAETFQDETKASIDKLLTEKNELKANLDDLAQKYARGETQGAKTGKSLGNMVIEDDAVKNFMTNKPRGSVQFKVNAAITSLTTDADGSAGDLVEAQRVAGIVGIPDRRMTVRDLLLPGTTSSNAIEYVRETGFTNAAAIQATEGTNKPESTLKFDLATSTVATIAHYMRASKQILDDAAMLGSYIDYRLRYGLSFVEEQQLLNGSGTSGNLTGLITAATAYADPSGGDFGTATMIDQLRLAMLQGELAEYPASGMVLNPIDWAGLELTKDSENRYIFANPTGMAGPRLWSLPVVSTQAMVRDKFLVGAFRPAAQIFDRQEATVEISTEDQDNFIKNLVTIRGEERLALAIYRPEALIYGDFGNVA